MLRLGRGHLAVRECAWLLLVSTAWDHPPASGELGWRAAPAALAWHRCVCLAAAARYACLQLRAPTAFLCCSSAACSSFTLRTLDSLTRSIIDYQHDPSDVVGAALLGTMVRRVPARPGCGAGRAAPRSARMRRLARLQGSSLQRRDGEA